MGRAHKVHFVRSVFGRGRARASKGPREPPRQQRACALRLSLFTPPTVPTLAGRRRAGGPGPQHRPGERGDFRPQRSAEARPERARAGDRAGAVERRQPLDHLRGCGAREHPAWARLRAPGSAHNAAARAQARWHVIPSRALRPFLRPVLKRIGFQKSAIFKNISLILACLKRESSKKIADLDFFSATFTDLKLSLGPKLNFQKLKVEFQRFQKQPSGTPLELVSALYPPI